MAEKKRSSVRVGTILDEETDAGLSEWAEAEGRSKRNQASVLLRRLTVLWRENPAALQELGLADKLQLRSDRSRGKGGK